MSLCYILLNSSILFWITLLLLPATEKGLLLHCQKWHLKQTCFDIWTKTNFCLILQQIYSEFSRHHCISFLRIARTQTVFLHRYYSCEHSFIEIAPRTAAISEQRSHSRKFLSGGRLEQFSWNTKMTKRQPITADNLQRHL